MKLKSIISMLAISFFLLFLMPMEESKILFLNYADSTSEIACLKKNQMASIKYLNGEILKVIGDEVNGKYLYYLRNVTDQNKDASVYIKINRDKIKYEKLIPDYPVIYKSPYFYLNNSLFNSHNDNLYNLNYILDCINNKLSRKTGIFPKRTRIIAINDTGIIFITNFIKTDFSKPNSFPRKAFTKNYEVNSIYLSPDSIRKYFNTFIKFTVFYTDFRLKNFKLISEFNHYHANILYYNVLQRCIYIHAYSSKDDPNWNYDKIFILNEKFIRTDEMNLNGIFQYKPYHMFKFKNNIYLLNPDSMTYIKNNKICKINLSEVFNTTLYIELKQKKLKNILF